MSVKNLSKAVALAATVVWAAGCSTSSTTTDSANTAADAGASAYGTEIDGQIVGQAQNELADVANLQRVFYFDFDKSVIKQDGIADLEAHAKYLAANPAASVRLEGHADERGTREYNMALGERRAQAVERFLIVNGASDAQIETISYGEEKPAIVGHDTQSWAQNRRVELKYVAK